MTIQEIREAMDADDKDTVVLLTGIMIALITKYDLERKERDLLQELKELAKEYGVTLYD